MTVNPRVYTHMTSGDFVKTFESETTPVNVFDVFLALEEISVGEDRDDATL